LRRSCGAHLAGPVGSHADAHAAGLPVPVGAA
jgi:hypothetical protein